MTDQPAEPAEAEVTALAEVIAEAHEQGIRAGGYSLARWILNAGYRHTEKGPECSTT